MKLETTIRVTKEFRFEAAHALKGYDGPCKNIHGHSYTLSVTVKGIPVNDPASSKLGMVMDFGDLKKLIRDNIIAPLDHSLLLFDADPRTDLKKIGEPFSNIILFPYQPTSENLLIDFADKIRKLLPKNIELHRLKLRETANSFAEWYASDNH